MITVAVYPLVGESLLPPPSPPSSSPTATAPVCLSAHSYSPIATLFEDEEVLVPVRIDITHKGVHVVDSVLWNLYNSFISPEEFAWKFCLDMTLPNTLYQKIAFQIYEQLSAFDMLVALLRNLEKFEATSSLLHAKLNAHVVDIDIRHNVFKYKDTFQWNPFSSAQSPEIFARKTCADIGLPNELEHVIAFRIRESIIRWLLRCLDQSSMLEEPSSIVNIVSDISLSMATPKESIDMITNLWKDHRPLSVEDTDVRGTRVSATDHCSAAAWLNVKK